MTTQMKPGEPVEVLAVAACAPSGPLLAAALDAPVAGAPEGLASSAGPYALDIRGWAQGRDRPVELVECVQEGNQRLLQAPVELERPDAPARPDAVGARTGVADGAGCGFAARVNCAFVPAEFELTVRAVVGSGDRADIAVIRGRRAPIRSSHSPRLRPLMITTLGRSGSTALLRLLAAHPAVAAYAEHEARVATYWLEVFRELSDPASYLRQLAPDPETRLTRGWWLARRPPFRLPEVSEDMSGWLGAEAVELLASTCHAQIDATYGALADRRGRSGAAFFAEKVQAGPCPDLLGEIWPGAREIVLCRDLRDMACSWIAYESRGAGGERSAAEAGADVVATIGDDAATLARGWLRRSDRAHLVRYEDLVTQPRSTIEHMVAHIGLETSPETLDAMASVVETGTGRSEHATTPDLAASVGRWRRELTADQQDACNEALGPALEVFGYEV